MSEAARNEWSRPALENIRALVTTKWKRGYSQRVIRHVESFFIDSSLDNDSDNWEVVLGDPRGDFLAMMETNYEVRVSLISSSPGAAGHIFTGISDDITFDEGGAITINGRDYASLALDSICPPCRFKGVKPKYVVSKQARELGFTNIALELNGQMKKTIKTDGSETFWEFWYRLYRNERMWLWVGPNGALVGSRLHYNAPVAYYFGTPKDDDTIFIKRQHIRVEGFQVRKSTQARVGWVYVVHTGKHRLPTIKVGDPTTKDWMKRPNKIITDTVSRSSKKATDKALEEIFEGKVGSLEIRLTVSEPGHLIQPNRMCRLRMPEFGYNGTFFIVGTKIQAGPDGFIQEVRLREKSLALTNRVPEEPKIPVPNKSTGVTVPGEGSTEVEGADAIMAGLLPDHPDWGKYYIMAAREFANGWNEDLFLAALLGTGYLETGFQNEREFTGHFDREIYYEFKYDPLDIGSVKPGSGIHPRTKEEQRREYNKKFCNTTESLQRLLGYSFNRVNGDAGVGPMMLTSPNLKFDADDHMPGGTHDEYTGGRWFPEHNIWAAAKYFAELLRNGNIASTSDDQQEAMWQAGSKYKYGGNSSGFGERHDLLRKAVLTSPGFLKKVRVVYGDLKENAKNHGIYSSDGTIADKLFPQGWPNEQQVLAAFQRGLWLGDYTSVPHAPFKPGAGPAVMPTPIWLAASRVNYRPGRTITGDAKWLVIHTSEYPQRVGTARNIANQFAGNSGPAGAHYCVDNAEIYQCVRESDTAFGTKGTLGGNSTNDQAIHIEHAGYADTSDWTSDYSVEMLTISAMLAAGICKRNGIPRVKLSAADLTAGNSGITGHVDIDAATGINDHHDPGDTWPWDAYIAAVISFMT